MAQWRRFGFFDKEIVKDAKNAQRGWMKGVDVTCSMANRGTIAFGDANGGIHLADRQLNVRKFQAYEHFVSHLIMLERVNLMVTVGDGIDPRSGKRIKEGKNLVEQNQRDSEQETHVPAGDVRNSTAMVKLWRTDQMDRDGKPKLLQQIRIFAKYPEEAVTAFAVSVDVSQVAVGLKNGAVILFRSDLKRPGEQKPPLLLQAAVGKFSVTYLGFTEVVSEGDNQTNTYLYAGTSRGLTSYLCDMTATKSPDKVTMLEERGVHINCAAMNHGGEIALGQNDAVYFFTPEDRGACYAFDGEKRYLQFFKHYLLVAHVDPRGRNQINVYDLKNKFIAFNWTLTPPRKSKTRQASDSEDILHVVAEFGSIFVMTSSGDIYRLTEKDIASKLEILYRKHLYTIAISLAFSANYDINNIMEIYRMHGDHLYEKGDFDGAVTQYGRTIGHLEPSYIIRRFLEAQRILNLTTYLEMLHEKSYANSDHTTLLLNCYTKLKDVKKLDRFISPQNTEHSDENTTSLVSTDAQKENEQGINALTFDVETAIRVLKQNYPEHALSLAKRHQEHSWYLKIQLENISYVDNVLKDADRARVADALEYITRLPFEEADSNLRKYGRTLVTHLPEETTEILKLLCTGRYVPTVEENSYDVEAASASFKSDPADFIHLYVAHPQDLKRFMEYIVYQEPDSLSPSIGNTLLELLLQDDTPKEELDRTDSEVQVRKSTKEDAVMNFLRNPKVKYDLDHALILVQIHGMKRGQHYLYEKLHMYQMLMQHHMEVKSDEGVMEQVKRDGNKDPSLWLLALKYFADRASDKGSGGYSSLKEILQLVDTYSNLPPLQVVQVLAQSKVDLPLAVVREFVTNRLKLDEAKISEDSEEIERYQEDITRMEDELKELKTKAIVFKGRKCDLCSHSLDPPSVHFKCLHSFHQMCLPEVDMECPQCAPEHRHIANLKYSLEDKAGYHEQFFSQLESSSDGFSTVAEYFGKGIFKDDEASKEIHFDDRYSMDQ